MTTNEPLFFRDAVGLDLVAKAVARLRDEHAADRPLRVWVPQCSAGHDAYSVAIRLLEAMGGRWRERTLTVFSTDSDEEALARARAGRYPLGACRDLPRETVDRFFLSDAGGVKVRPFVRDACRFASHDLAQPSPFARIDIVASRGLLAALPASLHQAALRSFHAALVPDGLLLDQTGRASEAPGLFHPVGGGRSYAARKPRA